MRIKSLAQGENILMLRFEPATFVSKIDILTTSPIDAGDRNSVGDNATTQVVVAVGAKKCDCENNDMRVGNIQPLCIKVSYLIRKKVSFLTSNLLLPKLIMNYSC